MQGTEYDPIFTKEELSILSRYVSDPNSDIFVFLPTLFGLGGAVFARYSRAPGGARVRLLKEFLNELGELKVDKLQELIARVLIAYGDDSVGELENAHLAMENISNLATKEIEDNRIGLSPIEQSSRYVVYDQQNREGKYKYLRPKEVVEAGLLKEYEAAMDFIFGTYIDLLEPMTAYFRKLKPENEAAYAINPDEKERQYKLSELTEAKDKKAWQLTYKTDIKTKTCDTLRGLLPAATLTNVGLSGNGRAYQNMLTKLLSHDLIEMQDLGTKAKDALSIVIPKYVERAQPNNYLKTVDKEMQELVAKLDLKVFPSWSDDTPVDLLYGKPFGEKGSAIAIAIAHILFSYTNLSLMDLYNNAEDMDTATRKKIFETYCQHKEVRGNRRNKPGRGLEFGYPITFDLIGDFGIYRDLERQRMLTQQRQLLNPYLGYEVPKEIIEAGFEREFLACVFRSIKLYELIKERCGPKVAQYAVLFAFNIRWYMGMNFREAFHFMELRTIPQGHPSYRRLIQMMHTKLMEAEPLIASMMEFVDYDDYYWSRAESEAAQRRKEDKI